MKRWVSLGWLWVLVGTAAALQNHPTSLVLERIASTPVTYPLRFVFLGDSRPGSGPNADSIFHLARERINALNPLFVVHGGDFVRHGYRSEYYHFMSLVDSFATNVLTVRGNHELYADEGPWMYDSIFGPTDYVWDYGRYRFIVLADCQQNPGTGAYGHYIDYLISWDQLAWLDSLLQDANSRGMISFVFAHVPPYQPGHDTTYCLGYENYYPQPNYEASHTEEFTWLLSQRGVPMAFFGHHHFYDRHEYNGVWYIISGGAGSPIYPYPLSPPPYGCACYHFLLFELDSLGHLEAYFYRIGEPEPDPYFGFSLDLVAVQEASDAPPERVVTRLVRMGRPLSLPEPVQVYGATGRLWGGLRPGEPVRLPAGVYWLRGATGIQRILVLP